MTEILHRNISINDSQNWEEILDKNLEEFESCNVFVNNINLISRFDGEETRKFDKRHQFQKQKKFWNQLNHLFYVFFSVQQQDQ